MWYLEHDPGYISLRTTFTSDDGVALAVFDTKSRLACYPDVGAVPVRTSPSARANEFVVDGDVCWDVRC